MEAIEKKTDNRFQTIIRYNIIGIAINLVLSTAKIIIGFVTNAHAVILDGIEGFSDLISSVFTIFSAKIGEKKADKTHPFGYGRAEYLASLLITIIIMLFGIRTIIESIQNILDPHEAPHYDTAVVTIMVLSLVLKLSYGFILQKKGRQINSDAMVMSGVDCMSDSVTSIAILAAILIKKFFDFDIEHYLCIGISLLIIATGVQMLRECVTKILGTSVDPEFKKKIKNTIAMEEGVYNVPTLVIHNYGEDVYVGSVEIEVDENMRAAEITKLSRRITAKADELGMTVTAVGITGTNTSSHKADEIRDRILDIVRQNKNIRRAHSFTVDFQEKHISFSIEPNYDDPDQVKTRQDLINELQTIFPEMTITIRTVKEI